MLFSLPSVLLGGKKRAQGLVAKVCCAHSIDVVKSRRCIRVTIEAAFATVYTYMLLLL